MSKRESINQEPLTIEELKTMAGLPVWCPEEEAYGIVMCDKIGQWAGIPFLHGVWYSDDDGVGVEFNHNIIGRKLKCFRVEDKKEIAMPLQNKEIGFGDQTLACPNCGQSAIANPFIKDREIYGSIMNLLEIWADGSIQGYLSAKQTLRIIERVKARESPR